MMNGMIELNIFMRFLHILSAVTLLGGVIAWRVAAIPATAPLAVDMRNKLGNAIAAAWRPVFFAAVAGLLVSGIYAYLNKGTVTPAWQAVIGIKFLLVLHVFAVGFLVTMPNNEKRSRQLTGIMISGVVIVALAAVLRYLSTAQ
jgi:hypothetical protein